MLWYNPLVNPHPVLVGGRLGVVVTCHDLDSANGRRCQPSPVDASQSRKTQPVANSQQLLSPVSDSVQTAGSRENLRDVRKTAL